MSGNAVNIPVAAAKQELANQEAFQLIGTLCVVKECLNFVAIKGNP